MAVSLRARACWAGRIVAHQAPCRGLSRDTPISQASASCHDIIVCIVTHLTNQITRLSRYKDCIVTQPPAARPSLLSRYITLYRNTHPQPGLARAAARPCAQLAVSWPPLAVSQPCHGRIVGVAGHVVALAAVPMTAVSRYNSLYRDSNGQ